MFDCINSTPEIKIALALAEDTPVEVLKQLSQDADREVRKTVASNPITPTEILLELGDEFSEIIINNPIFNLLLLEKANSLFTFISQKFFDSDFNF
jgi:hypothetical protein